MYTTSYLDLDLYIGPYTYVYDVIENGVCDTMKAFVWKATVIALFSLWFTP